jgi:hypothetical protein
MEGEQCVGADCLLRNKEKNKLKREAKQVKCKNSMQNY